MTIPDTTNAKTALYLRLSKEDIEKLQKGDDSVSIRNQQLLLEDFCRANELEIVKIYKDDNYSGLFDDRPAFEELLADAEKGMFKIVIAKSQSRFTRNMEHLEKYLYQKFIVWGVRFISIVDGIDTGKENTKKSSQINGLINEWYSEDLSKNIRSVFRAKMMDGQYIGSSAPYGYIKNPNNHHQLMIDEYAAGVVRKIYDLYLSGFGKGKIGVILSQEGILIPSIYKREVLKQNYYNAHATQNTMLWSYQTVHGILKNEVYIGHTIQNKCSSPSYKVRKVKRLPTTQWIKVENTHEPIISKEIFYSVQKMMERKTRTVNNEAKIGLFSGLLFCHDCGYTMVRSYSKKHDTSGKSIMNGYVCKIYKAHGNQICKSHYINNEVLERTILDSIKEQAASALLPEDINKISNTTIFPMSNFQKQKSDIEKKLESIQEIKTNAYMDYAKRIIDLKEYFYIKENLENQEKELENNLSVLEVRISENQEIEKNYRRWVEKFSNYMNIDILTREIVVGLIEKIEVYENQQIEIYYKFKNPYASP